MSRIVVLGDLNLDVYAHDPGGVTPGDEIRSSLRAVPGGSAGTFARVSAAEGATVTFIGCVGRDPIGDLLIRSLEEHGVRAAVGRCDLATGTILALERGGERSMICSRGANDGLTEAMVDEKAFDDVDHLHVSGYAFLSQRQRPAARRAILLALDRHATVSVDPPPAGLIERHGIADFSGDLEGVSWLFPNLSEGRVLTGLEAREAIVDALSERFVAGALTLGASGSVAWAGTERDVSVPAAVGSGNPTGAGDTFAAGFVVARLGGGTLAEANRRGCELASEHVRRSGDSSTPS